MTLAGGVQLKKLNFGCGSRYAAGWTNIDFRGDGTNVIRANLLSGFPFADHTFDAVYSSHVLEHFTPEQGAFLLKESNRVLRSGGTLRIVVPDLEASCREYLRVLEMDDSDPDKAIYYKWATIELMDQMVRSKTGGEMGPFINSVRASGDEAMVDYIYLRTESRRPNLQSNRGVRSLLANVTLERVAAGLTYGYLGVIKRCVPGSIRPIVWNEPHIGEKHRWMYDRYGLSSLVIATGFVDLRFCSFDESTIEGFVQDQLDSNPDGTPYKNVSLYCEATKS